jgi:hypothetical protein
MNMLKSIFLGNCLLWREYQRRTIKGVGRVGIKQMGASTKFLGFALL